VNVAVLGASDKPDRYGCKAFRLLREKGHNAIPVHPRLEGIDGVRVYASLADVSEEVDTITVYLSPANSGKVADEIVGSGARRVIFNPGAENPELAERLRAEGFEVIEACTLVMLKTGQF